MGKKKRQSYREKARKRQDNKCFFCGVEMLDAHLKRKHSVTIEHLVPRHRIKKKFKTAIHWYNTVASCRACNSAKGNKTSFQFLKLHRIGKHFHKAAKRKDIAT